MSRIRVSLSRTSSARVNKQAMLNMRHAHCHVYHIWHQQNGFEYPTWLTFIKPLFWYSRCRAWRTHAWFTDQAALRAVARQLLKLNLDCDGWQRHSLLVAAHSSDCEEWLAHNPTLTHMMAAAFANYFNLKMSCNVNSEALKLGSGRGTASFATLQHVASYVKSVSCQKNVRNYPQISKILKY